MRGHRIALYLRVVRGCGWVVGGRFWCVVRGRFRVVRGRFWVVGGRFRVVGDRLGVIRGRFGVVDRFLRFVCRSRVVVRFLLRIVRCSLIGDLGDISVVMISSILHMLGSPIGKSNGVRTWRVCTQLGRFESCHDCQIRRRI